EMAEVADDLHVVDRLRPRPAQTAVDDADDDRLGGVEVLEIAEVELGLRSDSHEQDAPRGKVHGPRATLSALAPWQPDEAIEDQHQKGGEDQVREEDREGHKVRVEQRVPHVDEERSDENARENAGKIEEQEGPSCGRLEEAVAAEPVRPDRREPEHQ